MELSRVDAAIAAHHLPLIVAEVSDYAYDGNVILFDGVNKLRKSAVRFRLRVADTSGKGSRKSITWSGERKTISACWHAHRDILGEWFKQFPDSRIKTAMALYDKAEGFALEYPKTAMRNVGAPIMPVYPTEQCECWDTGEWMTGA